MHFVKQTLIPHKHNNYRPHLIRRHGLAFALVLLVGVQIISALQIGTQPRVLGYASNITISGLLSGTNSERINAGKSTLSLNSQLNSAAQAKANHMIANDYWSHTAPDGTTPWYWFSWAGYEYLVAGENLAYGFNTSAGVIDGWMNSPSHRDNMLNSVFENVGFGIADGADFQGAPNTVVVAMYGDPAVLSEPSPPPTPSPTEPTTPATSPKPTPTPIPTPVESVQEEPTPEPVTEQVEEVTKPQLEEHTEAISQIVPDEPKRITNLDAIITGQADWALYTTAAVALLIGFVYAYRHILFIHNTIIKSEKYIVSHPMLEASIIYALIWLLLTGSFGNIL